MDKKRSVLISTWTYPPQQNGVSHVAQAHACGLANLGHDVTVVTCYDPNRDCDDQNVKLVQFNIGGNWTPRSIFNHFHGDIRGYQDYIADFTGDVIMFHCTTAWSTDLVLKIIPRIPAKTILISHGVSFNLGSFKRRMAWKLYTWRLYRIYKTFDHIVFLSRRSDNNRFMDKLIMERKAFDRWSVIPNGTSPALFKSNTPDFRKTYNIDPSKKIILCVANYSTMKNQEMALDAFLRSRQKDAVMIFIGSEMNEYARNLETKAKSLKNKTGRILFLAGLEPEMIFAAYKTADLFLHPSKTEVQPLVVLDAMASGTPFISSNVGCVDELPGGIVARSEKDMSEKINILINDDLILEKIKKAGLSACKNLYNWDTIVSNYDLLIDNVLKDYQMVK